MWQRRKVHQRHLQAELPFRHTSLRDQRMLRHLSRSNLLQRSLRRPQNRQHQLRHLRHRLWRIGYLLQRRLRQPANQHEPLRWMRTKLSCRLCLLPRKLLLLRPNLVWLWLQRLTTRHRSLRILRTKMRGTSIPMHQWKMLWPLGRRV